MKVVHLTRRHCILTGILLAATIGTTVLLGGCFQKESDVLVPLTAATDADRAAFLAAYGWEINIKAIETLDMVLPTDLSEKWSEYITMQETQGLPFADYGGQAVRRYTYAITNYPDSPQGAQANLYLYGDQIIGADIIVTGEGGCQHGLTK